MGEGLRVGNSCTPVVDSCQYMAKPIQYCKVKKKKMNLELNDRGQGCSWQLFIQEETDISIKLYLHNRRLMQSLRGIR